MDLRIVEQPATPEALQAYGHISIAFTAVSRLRLDLVDGGLGGVRLVEEPLSAPRDYDGDKIEGEGPASWARRWDLSRWVLLAAFDGQERLGGAVVARHTGDMWLLKGREDMVALWDIRVAPSRRRRGAGKALFEAAAECARRQGCHWLKIETQNINVAACRFYAAMGAKLGGIDHFAYANTPSETELDWFLEL